MSVKELDTLFPGQEFKIRGEIIKLKPAPFKDLKRIFSLIEQYLRYYYAKPKKVAAVAGTPEVAESEEDVAQAQEESFLDLLKNGGEQIQEDCATLIQISFGKDAEWLDTLSYDVVVYLLVEIFKANRDFFGSMGKLLKPQKPPDLAGDTATAD